MALMRWLRPRMPAVQKLSLWLKASLRATHNKFDSRCEAALCALADRLAAATALQELSVCWDVTRSSTSGNDSAASPSAFPLDASLLLPSQSRTARRAQRPLALSLRSLELSCEAGCVLCPQLSLLPCLEELILGPGGCVLPRLEGGWVCMLRAWHPGASACLYLVQSVQATYPLRSAACALRKSQNSIAHSRAMLSHAAPCWRRSPWEEAAGPVVVQPHSLAACLPRTLKVLCLFSARAVASLADLGADLAAALPSLRELCLLFYPHSDWGESWSANVGRLLEALLPLAGQLQVTVVAGRASRPNCYYCELQSHRQSCKIQPSSQSLALPCLFPTGAGATMLVSATPGGALHRPGEAGGAAGAGARHPEHLGCHPVQPGVRGVGVVDGQDGGAVQESASTARCGSARPPYAHKQQLERRAAAVTTCPQPCSRQRSPAPLAGGCAAWTSSWTTPAMRSPTPCRCHWHPCQRASPTCASTHRRPSTCPCQRGTTCAACATSP